MSHVKKFSLFMLFFALAFVPSCSRSPSGEAEQDYAAKEALPIEDIADPQAGLFFAESPAAGDDKVSRNESEEPSAKIEKARHLATSDEFRQRSPELLARFDGPDKRPLPFVSHDISVVIASHRARVVHDMVFENTTSRVLSGTLMVELPDGASPSYLGMFQGKGWDSIAKDSKDLLNPQAPSVDVLLAQEIRLPHAWQSASGQTNWGELRSARVVNPIQGRQVYENVTRQRIDPALAEWAGSGKFSTRIFPIPANGYKRVVFVYDQPLRAERGNLLYSLPLPKEIKAKTRLNVHLVGQSFSQATLLVGGQQITAVANEQNKSWELWPQADLKGSAIFQATPANANWQVLVGQDEKVPGKLVHLRYQPRVSAKKNEVATGKALFLVDTSYSAKDKLSAMSGKVLRALLENDTSISEFAVVGFDVRTRWITDGFVANSPDKRNKTLRMIENIWLEGATNFTSVLQFIEGQRELADANAIFLLSDGQITWGVENPQEFAKGFSQLLGKRWICYSFGDIPANKNLFQVLAHAQGQVLHVGLGQDLSETAAAHRHAGHSLDEVSTAGKHELVVAGDPKRIYPGQVLEIAVRTPQDAQEIKLIAKIDGVEQSVRIPLQIDTATSFLAARSWADLYATRLLNLYDETADAISLSLSQRFSLTNRQASFIILETDEEYTLYKIEPEQLDIRKIINIAQVNAARRPFGAPQINDLQPETLQFIDSLAAVDGAKVWQTLPPAEIRDTLDSLLDVPRQQRGKNTPADLYLWAKDLFSKDKAQALRVLSTIVEVSPQDDRALRLVGYVLVEWGMHQEALELFSRVRQRRPFEPQSYLMEAMALAAQGQIKEAAVRYEILLQREFPRFGEFTKPTAARLYADLLQAVANSNQRLATLCRKRLANLSIDEKMPRGRLLLFWNLDNTDVDLHILEEDGTEVSYSNKNSPSGGRLFWDNTAGLGPELYQHPTLSRQGSRVFVNYFGSSDVEGQAPAATLVAAFTASDEQTGYQARWYTTVLLKAQGDKVFIMPTWKR